MTDIDINAADRRAHKQAITRMIVRGVTVVLITAIAAIAWRCDPDVQAYRARARAEKSYWRGVAQECNSRD